MIRPNIVLQRGWFKPTFGLIPRSGVLRTSADSTVGTFGRTPEDAALLADVLAGHDQETDTVPAAARLLEAALSDRR